MPFFNNKRKDFSIQLPKQQVDGTPFFVTDSANIDFTLANLNLSANLTTTGITAGTYGDSTHIPVLTLDNYGRVTGVSIVAITATGILLQTNGVTNPTQTILNLIAGTNMVITDDGLGNITFDASGGGGSGTVTSVSAGTGMSFTTIITSGSVDIDITKVPYIPAGFSTGLLKWDGTDWVFDNNTYLTTISGLNISLLTNDSGYITSAALAGYVPTTRTLTINGTTYDLSADRSWTITSSSPLTTKGDLYTFNTTNTRLPVGLPTQVLLADPSTPTGLKWGTNTTPPASGYYGAFSDVTDQTAAAINTGYPMRLGVTDLSNGVTVVSNSRVTIANTGIYNIQWSAQFRNPTSSEQDVTIWLRKNGVDVAGSAGVVSVPKKHGSVDGHTLPSWNFLLDPIAGDYYEFVWSTTDTSVYINFEPAGSPPPSTASVVLTVTQQAGILAGTGITAINSLTAAAQTLASTDLNISSAVATHNFSIANNAVTYAKMQAISAVSKLLGSSSTTTPVQEITLGTNLSMSGTTLNATGGVSTGAIVFQFDGAGGVIPTGQYGGYYVLPYNFLITSWRLLSTTRGATTALSASIVVDTYSAAAFPNTTSIWGGSKPTLTTASSATATGLSISLTAGNLIGFNVDSSTLGQLITLTLIGTKS